jgi:mRNA-degrading endonuclease RelE of RelBE toxin-antitoxin system
MNCRDVAISAFRKDAKKLLKKYASLKSELEFLGNQLLENPRLGKHIHENTYKIRLSVKSKGKGKSGGLRVITHIVEIELQVEEKENEQDITVFLVAIYDKSEMEDISESKLKALIQEVNSELDNEENA